MIFWVKLIWLCYLTHLILFHPFNVRAALELEYAESILMDGLIYFVYFMLESSFG